MKGIDNKRKEALTGGSILPGGCCPFVVTGNDGDNPVVLVFVVALCSWFDAFVVWCTTTSLDKGRGKRPPVYAIIIYETWATALQADISTGETAHQPKFSHMLV